MRRLLGAVVGAWLALVLTGCATRTTVVLLPEAGGRPTAVSVERTGSGIGAGGTVLLDQPYAGVREGLLGARPFQATPQQVDTLFGPALAAQPARATRFTLYFIEGRDVLTDESRQLVDTSLAEIAKRPVPDVLVVGHTDLVGSHATNDALSRQRAELIRSELIRLGVAADNIVVIARGKREPIVPTADGVAEPRNRRVEVVVR
jgi:outer membrane protein OmpA-like peptidoglycan-associated protein